MQAINKAVYRLTARRLSLFAIPLRLHGGTAALSLTPGGVCVAFSDIENHFKKKKKKFDKKSKQLRFCRFFFIFFPPNLIC